MTAPLVCRPGRRGAPRLATVLALLAAPAAPLASLAAQDTTVARPAPLDAPSLFERLNLDKLRLSGLGVSVGAVKPTQIRATQAYAVIADYGRVAERWNVLFSVTYWGSQYSERTLRTFRDSLRKVIVDTTGDYRLELGRVTVSDIALGTELRWSPRRAPSTLLRPYVGGGIAAHVVNAEGKAISGTFVERALDNITAGIIATTGVDAVFYQHLGLGMQARYDLVSGARFGSVRVVGSYIFDPAAQGRGAGRAP